MRAPRHARRQLPEACLRFLLVLWGTTAFAGDGDFENALAGLRNPRGPRQHLGVFIGINEYRDPKLPNLRGCVNDAVLLRTIFSAKFGFTRTALLTNASATRANIGRLLDALIDEARQIGREGTGANVVIAYSGHGSRVRDQDGDERDEDGSDETWVAYDSNHETGDRDIRDDDIRFVIRSLVDARAQVLLLVDSCNSGTVHRGGQAIGDRQVDRRAGRSPDAPGPTGSLITEARSPEASRSATGQPRLLDGEPLKGFVAFTACADGTRAFECYSRQHRQYHGRFTYALWDFLSRLQPHHTYRSVHTGLVNTFSKSWPSDRQVPQLHATAFKAGELFLGGAFPPSHAALVPDSQHDSRLEVTMGSIHGVWPGATFRFYRSLGALSADAPPLIRGTAEEVGAFSAVVRLEPASGDIPDVPRNAVARLEDARLPDFRVAAHVSLPGAVRDTLRGLADQRRIVLTDEITECDYAIALCSEQPSEERLAVGFYTPTALPTAPPAVLEGGEYPTPRHVVEIDDHAGTGDADRLAEHILYLGRIHRFMGLEHKPEELQLTLVHESGEPAAELNGIAWLTDRAAYRVRARNLATASRYLSVFVSGTTQNRSGQPHQMLRAVYPGDAGEEALKVKAGHDVLIPPMGYRPFRVGAERPVDTARMLILALDRPRDLAPLLHLPEEEAVEVPKRRGNEMTEYLYSLVSDNRPARGSADLGNWASSLLVFEVCRSEEARKRQPESPAP